MNLLSGIFSSKLINALGWTLLHSLWQIAAIALTFALLMLIMNRFSARTRYMVGLMALALAVAVSLTTFVTLYQGVNGSSILKPAQNTAYIAQHLNEGAGNPGMATLTPAGFKAYFSRHLPLVVTIWMLGFMVLLLRLTGGLILSRRLKTSRVKPLVGKWHLRLEELGHKMNLSRPVQLLESARIKAPVTLGFLKPVILLPAGMVTGLPLEQVEALLVHELAHIIRKDYLVNILQNIVDIVFFYHPGARWISAQVRHERENCCDDMTVSVSGDSMNLAKALANAGLAHVAESQPLLTAVGRKTRLLSRIKRILKPYPKGSDFTEGFVGAAILVVFLLFLVVGVNAAPRLIEPIDREQVQTQEEKEAKEKKAEQEKEMAEAEAKLAEKREHLEQIEQTIRANLKEEVLKREQELVEKNKERLIQMELKFKQHLQEIEKKEQERIVRMEEELLQKEKELQKIHEKELAALEKETDPQRKAQLEQREKELSRMQEKLEQRRMDLRKKGELRVNELKFQLQQKRSLLEQKNRELSLKALKEIELRKEEFEKRRAKKIEGIEQELAAKKRELDKQRQELLKHKKELKKHEKFLEQVKDELLKDRLIEDPEDFELKLTAKGFWVNGKKQSKNFFKKYTKIYQAHNKVKLDGEKSFRVVNKKD